MWDSSYCTNCQEDVTGHQSRRAGTKRLVQTSIYALITTTILPRLVKASLCHAHFIYEVERIVHSECTPLSDESNNRRCSQSYRTWSSPCYAMPITQSLMQVYRTAYSAYNTQRTRGEKEKKAKVQRLKDQGEEEVKEQKEALVSMEREKRKLEDRKFCQYVTEEMQG